MEKTRITIRGISHWTGATSESAVNDANDNAPLVMIDGIERTCAVVDNRVVHRALLGAEREDVPPALRAGRACDAFGDRGRCGRDRHSA